MNSDKSNLGILNTKPNVKHRVVRVGAGTEQGGLWKGVGQKQNGAGAGGEKLRNGEELEQVKRSWAEVEWGWSKWISKRNEQKYKKNEK